MSVRASFRCEVLVQYAAVHHIYLSRGGLTVKLEVFKTFFSHPHTQLLIVKTLYVPNFFCMLLLLSPSRCYTQSSRAAAKKIFPTFNDRMSRQRWEWEREKGWDYISISFLSLHVMIFFSNSQMFILFPPPSVVLHTHMTTTLCHTEQSIGSIQPSSKTISNHSHVKINLFHVKNTHIQSVDVIYREFEGGLKDENRYQKNSKSF